MKLLILSQSPKSYSTHRLYESAKNLGHKVKIENPLSLNLQFGKKLEIKDLSPFNCVLPRFSGMMAQFGVSLVKQFELLGYTSLNSSEAFQISKNKVSTLQILNQNQIPVPITYYGDLTKTPKQVNSLLDKKKNYVFKVLNGSQGEGVFLTKTKEDRERIISTLRELGIDYLIQEFIAEAKGKDLRVFVIGDQVVATMERQALKNDFRSNIKLGGTPKKVKLSSELTQLAVKSSQALGLDVSGVDIILSKKGPLVLEVNSCPGLQGIETCTKIDIAQLMIKKLQEKFRVKI